MHSPLIRSVVALCFILGLVLSFSIVMWRSADYGLLMWNVIGVVFLYVIVSWVMSYFSYMIGSAS